MTAKLFLQGNYECRFGFGFFKSVVFHSASERTLSDFSFHYRISLSSDVRFLAHTCAAHLEEASKKCGSNRMTLTLVWLWRTPLIYTEESVRLDYKAGSTSISGAASSTWSTACCYRNSESVTQGRWVNSHGRLRRDSYAPILFEDPETMDLRQRRPFTITDPNL